LVLFLFFGCFLIPPLLSPDRFPETQGYAERAVATHRAGQRGTKGWRLGEEDAGWDMDDVALAVENRLLFLQRSMERLKTAGQAVVAALWPGGGAPEGRVALWLEHAKARLEVWKASAARAGAQMALRFVTSWYTGVNLDRLTTMRAVPEAERLAREDALVRRANEFASYVDLDVLLPALGEDGEPVAEDSFGNPEGPEDDRVAEESTASSTDGGTGATETTEADPKAAASSGRAVEPAGDAPVA
jgi:hypothetical protein